MIYIKDLIITFDLDFKFNKKLVESVICYVA